MRDKHSPQKILVTITLAVALLIGSAITVVAWRMHNENKQNSAATSQTETKNTSKPANSNLVSYKGQNGKTALELLKQNAKVVTKDSSYGPYVDSINGVAGGREGKYWTFYVNGEQAQVGAGAYTTKNSETIEWKFE